MTPGPDPRLPRGIAWGIVICIPFWAVVAWVAAGMPWL